MGRKVRFQFSRLVDRFLQPFFGPNLKIVVDTDLGNFSVLIKKSSRGDDAEKNVADVTKQKVQHNYLKLILILGVC